MWVKHVLKDQESTTETQNYASKKSTSAKSAGSAEEILVDTDKALSDLKEWMRVKHYAYKTEQSYLGWCRRFFKYSRECSGEKQSEHVPVSPQLITRYNLPRLRKMTQYRI